MRTSNILLRAACCIFTSLLPFSNLPAQDSLASVLRPLIDAHEGHVAVAIHVLGSDNQTIESWDYQGKAVLPTASLIKLPIMIEAYRQADVGRVSLDDSLRLTGDDKVPGSGILTDHFSDGVELPLRDCIRLMIRYSDNSATNLVLDRIGLGSTASAMSELGFPETQVHSKVFKRDTSINRERSEKYGLGSTTALDTVNLLAQLQRGEIASPAACREMLEHLKTCDDSSRFPRFLPTGTVIAQKTGSVNKTRTAAGIIYSPAANIALCVLTNDNKDVSWSDDNEAHLLCAHLAKAAYDYVNRDDSALPQAVELAQGASGDLVEALQRTLNERLGSDLSCDGDFGPATEAAVKRFQADRQLPATGTVSSATWRALGPLVERDLDVVRAPEAINSEDLERAVALDPESPPEVSAKAYAVLNRTDGTILAMKNGEQSLANASTTKLMTAYLILHHAMAHPEVLDEIVTFSERADRTPGSTSGLRAGEQLPVSELLYGLLLPSGNDASVALAEHFGVRFANTSADATVVADADSAYAAFIHAMNAKAHEMGLESTHYRNPHGLTDEGHHSSALDLAKLARAALAVPRLQEYVGCRQRGCRVTSVSGYTRDVAWHNTNRLLAQEGFYGLKTGTTDAAGACLIAAGKRDDQDRIVVVLGSANSDARYVDARNLFSWSWR